MKTNAYLVFCLILTLATVHTACTPVQPPSQVNAVYTLYTKTVIESNIKYALVDSVELLLDVYYPAKKLGKDPYVEI